ncbi:hypothetical protein DFH08DRAFT_959612 [Mycena albidolilacea]|uniref:Uncharacterized protein n=1 Tax=Mycena albidolilacea TaxID=1033008 RepID=A0AAD7ESD5_9AGAR|nr:hypothetical protein DFH08DRAFT_959612 [Mycena albidolilacea]
MSVKSQSPLGSAAVVSENILIVFMSTINLILLILVAVAVRLGASTSTFLVLPFTVEWLALVISVIYLLVRESRKPGTPPSLSGAAFMFGTQTILGLVTSIAVTNRAWPGSALCADFGKVPNSCSVALAFVGLSWIGTTIAFAGVLLSYAGPLYRLYHALRTSRRPGVISNGEHVIELADLPSARYQPSLNNGKGREEWTDIAF